MNNNEPLTATILLFDDLTDDEKKYASVKGCGKESAQYLRVEYGGKTILLESDAMDPDSATFFNDLSWVTQIIRKAYSLGVKDGKSNA